MRTSTAKKGQSVWALTHVYDKRSDAVTELFAGTAREVVEKIVEEFDFHETFNHKTPTLAELREFLDNEWMLFSLELLKVK